MPPSTVSDVPVMYDASSEDKKSTARAKSSSALSRLAGTIPEKRLPNYFEVPSQAGVRIALGKTALTRISVPKSMAKVRVIASTPLGPIVRGKSGKAGKRVL